MKIVTIVFALQLLHVCCAGSFNLFSDDSPTTLVPASPGLSTIIGKVVSNITFTVLPKCILGANFVSFILFTRENREGQELSPSDETIPMILGVKTVMVVHGFTSDANATAFNELFNTWLDKENINILSLDWREGACSTGLRLAELLAYPNAVENTVEVGEFMANFTVKLYEKGLLRINETKIVGHSLGAQVCGFAGKAINRMMNVSYQEAIGLDPAAPLFTGKPCERRFCKTDASFVQAFHTSLLGMHQNVGLVDFYFNGGTIQPGCITLSCSHLKSIEYFKNSLKPDCFFVGRPWPLDSRARNAMPSSRCTRETCSVAGLSASLFGGRGSLLVTTNRTAPYCSETTLSMLS